MKKIAAAAALLLILFFVFATRNQSSGTEPLFNELCQYPTRTTNPEGGCDNSDPCDPQSAAKGGSGECADYIEPVETPTLAKTPMSHNINTEVIITGK